MPKLTQRGIWLLVAVSVFLGVPAWAQIRIVPARKSVPAPRAEASPDLMHGLLRRAEQFESEQRWGEALSAYEEALRDYPDHPAVGDRHNLAKIHYDLGRRYSDSSFLRSLTTLSDRQAVALYSEVLVKIESHYVNAPDWTALVSRGTQDLEIALREDIFARRNLQGSADAAVDAFATQVRQLLQRRAPRSRQQAVDFVTTVVQMGRQQLRLAPASIALEYTCGAIGALDTYSTYLTSDQLNDVYSQIEGNFVGLGIELKAGSGGLQIVKVITGSPADRAGIRAGDRITEVDDKNTAELTIDQAADLLQGQEGSTVNVVTITSNDIVRRMNIRREHVEVPSIDDVKIVDRESGIGYLKLTCFQKTTSRDLDAALWKLNREGMKSLIIDLRGNPGGLLTSSVEIADKFIEEGVIVSTRGRSPAEDYNYTAHKAGTWGIPLIVLIDSDSASASEILAGAIKDHRRGRIIGKRSYGKGSVQGIFPLALAGSGVRLTTAKFYSPNGHPITHVGVMPDQEVREAAKPVDGQNSLTLGGAEDAVLAAGVQYIRDAARRPTAQR